MSADTNQSYRKYAARMFSRAALVCPRCRGRSKDPSEACPRCGFDFATSAVAFPFAAPPLTLLIDPSSLLPPGLEGEIQGSYAKFRKRFPAVDFSFCFIRLQPGVAIQEFAFWLHNSAPQGGPQRAWQILVVGDLSSGRLALTSGYALEPFLAETHWEAALQELAACLADDQWKEGLCGFLTDARDLLTISWAAAERRRQHSDRKIRDEHRAGRSGRDRDRVRTATANGNATGEPVAPPANPGSEREERSGTGVGAEPRKEEAITP